MNINSYGQGKESTYDYGCSRKRVTWCSYIRIVGGGFNERICEEIIVYGGKGERVKKDEVERTVEK